MKKYVWIAIAVITLASCNQEQKTGFINNKKVISEFEEMKEAQEKWTKKNDEVRAELEQKAKQFQLEVQGYQGISKSLTPANREQKEKQLMAKQQGLQQEQQYRLQEIQQGSQTEIDTIVNKVKRFIEDYGKKNGYTYIYGETEVSNLLYAKEDLDLTDEIIKALNSGASKDIKIEQEDKTTEEKADTTAVK